MNWILCLNRKTSKMKNGPQIQFPRGKWREQKKKKMNKKTNLSKKSET